MIVDLSRLMSANEIARECGVSVQTVINRRAELDAVKTKGQWLINIDRARAVFTELPDRRQRPRRRPRIDPAA